MSSICAAVVRPSDKVGNSCGEKNATSLVSSLELALPPVNSQSREFADPFEALAIEGVATERQSDLCDGPQFSAHDKPRGLAHPPAPATAQPESKSNSPVRPVPVRTMKPGPVLNCIPAATKV